MSEPTERQVLYGLVALGFHVVVGVLIAGAAIAGAVGTSVTIGWVVVWTGLLAWGAGRWRRTSDVLLGSVGLFVVWVVVTLVTT